MCCGSIRDHRPGERAERDDRHCETRPRNASQSDDYALRLHARRAGLGIFIVEIIFSWPGLGRITLDAILTQDQYLVMGAVLMASVVLIVGNLVADLLLALADPRISYD